MQQPNSDLQTKHSFSSLPLKLWIYTNYHCNLRCSYCVAESTPQAAQRIIHVPTVTNLIDETAALKFEHIYFTGGEPFILKENSSRCYPTHPKGLTPRY